MKMVKITGKPWLIDENNPYVTTVAHAMENNIAASLCALVKESGIWK